MASKVQAKRRLLLHFDVNETIMLGDPAGGDTFLDSLNKSICKNAFVRPRGTAAKQESGSDSSSHWLDAWEWHDGTPLNPKGTVPGLVTAWEWPAGCTPAYRVPELKRAFAKTFASDPASPGYTGYNGLLRHLEEAMRLPRDSDSDSGVDGNGVRVKAVDPRLVHEDGQHYRVIPAFFATLQALVGWPPGSLDAGDDVAAWAGRDFAAIVRTFGTDGPDVMGAIAAWAEGKHPTFPGPPTAWASAGQGSAQPAGPASSASGARSASGGGGGVAASLWVGSFDKGTGAFSLKPAHEGHASVDAEASVGGDAALDEASAAALMAAAPPYGLCVQDDYKWWDSHGWLPSFGKPLWVDTDELQR